MTNSCSALYGKNAKKIPSFFFLSVFGYLLFVLIAANANFVQAQNNSSNRNLPRKNPKQTMLEQMKLENANEKASPVQSGASVPGGVDPAFNASIISTNSVVETIAPLADGKVLIGGSFTSYNGAARSNIARLNGDGTVDQNFNAAANGTVRSIFVQADGKILIGGSFTQINAAARGNAARLNADGTLDTTFNFGGADSVVHDIKAQTDGKIVIGGDFSAVANTPRSRIARLNTDGSLDASFNPGAGPNNSVYGLDLQADGKIMIVGLFDYVSGVFRRQAARLNTDGSFDPTFTFNNINFLGGVGLDVLVQPDGKILLAGFFQDQFLNIIMLDRVNPTGTRDQNFSFVADDFLDNYIEDIDLLPDGKIAIGGLFSIGASPQTRHAARLNANGTLDTAFNPGTSTNSSVEAVAAQTDGKILIGGYFTSYQGAPQNRLARLNASGGLDSAFNTGSGVTKSEPGTIYASIAQADGKILIGGDFQQVNGTGRNNIARLNADGSLDTTFDPGNGTEFPPGSFSPVYSIAIAPNNQIIIGGCFSRFNNQFADNIARLNPNGSFDANFLGFTYDPVWKVLVQPNGDILVGGQFTYFNDLPMRFIVRLKSSGDMDFSFNRDPVTGNNRPNADSTVFDIALQPDGKIIIAGEFLTYSNAARNRIARLNQDGSLDTTFAPNGGANAAVRSAALQADAKILVGGSFTSVNSAPRGKIARLNGDGTLDASFNPGTGANQTIFDIQPLLGGKLLIGGSFTQFNNAARKSLARLNTDGSLDLTFAAQTDGVIRNISPYPGDKALIGGFFRNVSGTARTSIARIDPFSVTTQPGTPYDFDGDRKTDIGIFRASDGSWWYSRSSDNQPSVYNFGTGTDILSPGDFTGDGRADIAVFRPSTGEWFIQRSEDNSFFSFTFGVAGDIPAPSDYDGDGKTDPAVFRPSSGTWYILNSAGGGTSIVNFGASEDRPVAADYDGDGKSDIAIFRPSDGSWWYLQSSNLQFNVYRFGVSTDKPVQGDYTGDGRADIAVWRPSTGEWFVQRSEDNSFYSVPFGANGDIPAPGDYDGDGKADTAVFRPSTANWFVNRSSAGILITTFGASGDRPIPNAFVP